MGVLGYVPHTPLMRNAKQSGALFRSPTYGSLFAALTGARFGKAADRRSSCYCRVRWGEGCQQSIRDDVRDG